MNEYISKEALREKLNRKKAGPATKRYTEGWNDAILMVKSMIHSEKAADVAPVRRMPCPYCDAKTNDFIPINQTVEYSGIEIALNRQGMLRVRVYESRQETFTSQDIVGIKYCPHCGCRMDL